METKENILYELQQISPALAEAGKHNVYSVPAGYFEELADAVLAGVQMANRPVPFSVPDGYFDSLSSSVLTRIKAESTFSGILEMREELREISPLLNSISNKNPYVVPPGYFAKIADAALQQITEGVNPHGELDEISPLVNSISRLAPYSIPAGYFETLAASIINELEVEGAGGNHLEVVEEMEGIAPLLNTISKQPPYAVPENYFNQFAVNIPAENTVAKVVDMHRPQIRQWMVWLAAACMAGIVATGALLYQQGNTSVVKPTVNITQSLSDISDDEINNYLNNMPAPGAETIPSSVLDEQVPDVEPAINNMSTEEIKDYLDKNSDPGEKRVNGI